MDKGDKLGAELQGKAFNNTVDKAADGEQLHKHRAGKVANNAVDEEFGAFNNAVNTVGNVANTGLKAVFGAGSKTSTNMETDKEFTDNSEDITEIERINRNIKNNKETINLEQLMETTMNKHITNEFLSACNASSTVSNAFVIEKLEAESTGGDVNITPEIVKRRQHGIDVLHE